MKKIIKLVIIMMLVLVPVKSMGTDTGHSKTVQITAKPGYQVTDVIVNGESKGPLTSYTFSDVLSPQSLEVITEAIGYTVTFNANGGEGSMEDQVFTTFSQPLIQNTFTKEGYLFNGWSTTADGEILYRDKETCFINSNTILYAKWGILGDANGDGVVDVHDMIRINIMADDPTADGFRQNADFNMDGTVNIIDSKLIGEYIYGNITMEELSTHKFIVIAGDLVAHGTEEEEWYLPKFYKGQTVVGYYDASYGYGSHVIYDDFEGSFGFWDNYILYPIYAGKIIFNSNGGNGTMSSQRIEKISQKVTKNTFTKEGYAFLGWSTTADGEVMYKDEDIICADKNQTLYAVWGLYGDTDGDGTLSLADGTALSVYIQENKEMPKNLDVNQDGFIDRVDLGLQSQAINGSITLPYTGIVVYNDVGILQQSASSFDYTIVARTDASNGDLLGYFVNDWGGQYKKVGDTITISSNTELLPVWSEVLSGGSDSNMCTVTVTISDSRYVCLGNKKVTSNGTYEVPIGTPIYVEEIVSGNTTYSISLYIDGTKMPVRATSGMFCSVYGNITITTAQKQINITTD